eukprot:TRINITY_DN32707_c0_g1_i1.p2 TRINITY_DN32707_c0_g1~~TRINITY_DN32707_c0_g1_i1.p2  ORF type:complete len:220 (+),score=27.19 TRINITY_DN32707_c0_g1_i1:205-864(+)
MNPPWALPLGPPRYMGPSPTHMDPSQKAVLDEIAASRPSTTGVRGPFGPWIGANPSLALHAQRTGAVVRSGTAFPLEESEIAILATATHHRCPTEWDLHVGEARRGGVPETVIEAIAAGVDPLALPSDATDRQRTIYRVALELLRTSRLSDETYADAVRGLATRPSPEAVPTAGADSASSGDGGSPDGDGAPRVAEVVCIVGYYTWVAWTLNTFRVPSS